MKMQQAMMELYKKEKVNPMAGCLPILVTFPVFLGLYRVLMESVELRQAPFFGWIHDLSAPDPFFVLPAIYVLVMLATQWLTPTTGMVISTGRQPDIGLTFSFLYSSIMACCIFILSSP